MSGRRGIRKMDVGEQTVFGMKRTCYNEIGGTSKPDRHRMK